MAAAALVKPRRGHATDRQPFTDVVEVNSQQRCLEASTGFPRGAGRTFCALMGRPSCLNWMGRASTLANTLLYVLHSQGYTQQSSTHNMQRQGGSHAVRGSSCWVDIEGLAAMHSQQGWGFPMCLQVLSLPAALGCIAAAVVPAQPSAISHLSKRLYSPPLRLSVLLQGSRGSL